MKSVYMVFSSEEYEEDTFEAVFSTLENAEAYKQMYKPEGGIREVKLDIGIGELNQGLFFYRVSFDLSNNQIPFCALVDPYFKTSVERWKTRKTDMLVFTLWAKSEDDAKALVSARAKEMLEKGTLPNGR